jgi:hypothetical protein
MRPGCSWPGCRAASARYGVAYEGGILCAEHSDEAATLRAEAQEEVHEHGRR